MTDFLKQSNKPYDEINGGKFMENLKDNAVPMTD